MPDASSLMNKSRDHLKGNGVEKDRRKAYEYMLEAACCGSPEAASSLFDMSQRTDDEATKEEVVRVLEAFAESGSVPSMVRLSRAYERGYGVEKNFVAATEWMRRASEAGYEPAACKLFDMLASSDDPRLRERALDALEPFSASTRGSTVIRRALAYREGYGVERDLDKALSVLGEASGFKSKWNGELYRFALMQMRGGRDAAESLSRSRADERDAKIAGSIPPESRNRLYAALIEAFLGEGLSYVDWVSEEPDPAGSMSKDFNTLVNILRENRSEDLVRPANVAAALNGVLAESKARGVLDDEGMRRVFRSIRVDDPYLKQMQDGLTALLEVFDALCRANGIRYLISCGTLLGACRHDGFIPWDDDTDIYMMSEDYAKLARILRKDPVLTTLDRMYASSLKGHGVNYAHQVVFRSPNLRIIHLGVMTFDYVGSADDEGWDVYRDYIDRRRQLVDSYTKEDKRNGDDPLKDRRIQEVYKDSMDNFRRDLGGDSGKAVALTFDNPIAFAKRKLFDYEDFFPERPLKFNGLTLPAPNRPAVILERLYGDYMQFPSNLLVHRHAAWDDENAGYIRDYLDKLRKGGKL